MNFNKRNEYMREYSKRPEAKLKKKLADKKYRSYSPERNKETKLKSAYKITLTEYTEMFNKQNGVCAICNNPETVLDYRTGNLRYLSVDHCHKTGKVRGLLCGKCNRGMGWLGDSTDTLQSAIKYLEGR